MLPVIILALAKSETEQRGQVRTSTRILLCTSQNPRVDLLLGKVSLACMMLHDHC
jgi:hypothetical protein